MDEIEYQKELRRMAYRQIEENNARLRSTSLDSEQEFRLRGMNDFLESNLQGPTIYIFKTFEPGYEEYLSRSKVVLDWYDPVSKRARRIEEFDSIKNNNLSHRVESEKKYSGCKVINGVCPIQTSIFEDGWVRRPLDEFETSYLPETALINKN